MLATNSNGVKGVTLWGRQHKTLKMPCQDYHLYRDLGEGWHMMVLSDGAGSASQSHRGAKAACEVVAYLLQRLIEAYRWKENDTFPSPEEWGAEFNSVCRFARKFIIEKAKEAEDAASPKDFNATVMVAVVTPHAILSGHIGDGRMAYKDKDGSWHTLITPHGGTESNHTIFLLSDWDTPRVPMLRMAGVRVPETNVVATKPAALCMTSDGCENFSWNCLQPHEGKWVDTNTPFTPFWEHLVELAGQGSFDTFVRFIDSGNKAREEEDDDRTLLLALF